MKTKVIQSYRAVNVPTWIGRCLQSVKAWSQAQGFDYQLVGDECFRLCGEDYLSRVGDNIRSITNLARLVLVRQAHEAGYDRAIWIDADVFVFAPEKLRIDLDARYAFAGETCVTYNGRQWMASSGVNNSIFVCMSGEPDLDFLIATTRHIALHRQIHSNYQVGGEIIKGLRLSLDYQILDNVGMFMNIIVLALAHRFGPTLSAQARFHGTPVYAANLCASAHYKYHVPEAETLAAMDALAETGGEIVNGWLAQGRLYAQNYPGFTAFEISGAQPTWL